MHDYYAEPASIKEAMSILKAALWREERVKHPFTHRGRRWLADVTEIEVEGVELRITLYPCAGGDWFSDTASADDSWMNRSQVHEDRDGALYLPSKIVGFVLDNGGDIDHMLVDKRPAGSGLPWGAM